MELGLEPVTAVRFVSFTASALTLAVVATFAARLFGDWAGLMAGALYPLLPFTVLYSVLGLYDPLATLFITTAMALQYEHARQPRLDLALLLGLTFAGGVLTKLTAYSALYLLPVSALAFDWSRAALPRRLFTWLGGLTLALLLAFVATRIILLSELADDLATARQQLAQNTLGRL
jgi:4-amino-4-deoxy-L-arabinose transferase-like glycosyltransferase